MVTHSSTNLYLSCLTSNSLHSVILPLSYWYSSCICHTVFVTLHLSCCICHIAFMKNSICHIKYVPLHLSHCIYYITFFTLHVSNFFFLTLYLSYSIYHIAIFTLSFILTQFFITLIECCNLDMFGYIIEKISQSSHNFALLGLFWPYLGIAEP